MALRSFQSQEEETPEKAEVGRSGRWGWLSDKHQAVSGGT